MRTSISRNLCISTSDQQKMLAARQGQRVQGEHDLWNGFKRIITASFTIFYDWSQRMQLRTQMPDSLGLSKRPGLLVKERKRRRFSFWRSLQVLFFLLLGFTMASLWKRSQMANSTLSVARITMHNTENMPSSNISGSPSGHEEDEKDGDIGTLDRQPSGPKTQTANVKRNSGSHIFSISNRQYLNSPPPKAMPHQSALQSRIHAHPKKMNFSLYNGNGTMHRVPKALSRLHFPWFVPTLTFRLKSKEKSGNRILYSPFRHHLSDGIGHSMAIINFEIRLANRLGLTYSHRVANYSSLTEKDPAAVEDFFGWGECVTMKRNDLQDHVCRSVGGGKWASRRWSGRFECNICASLKAKNKYGLRNFVELPDHVAYKCVKKSDTKTSCGADVEDSTIAEYLEEIGIPGNSLVSIPNKICKYPVSDGQFGDTKTYYWHKYWERHRFPSTKRPHESQSSTRRLQLSDSALNIAVHIRRGDFLNPIVGNARAVIADETYAELLCRMLQIVLREGGPFSEAQIHVHIFSEGRLLKSESKYASHSVHGVEDQDRKYYDARGTPRSESWWRRLIIRTAKMQLKSPAFGKTGLQWPDKRTMVSTLRRLQVRYRIAESTLGSMHDMVSADLFLGSKSGTSMNAVWALARGVSLLPKGTPVGTEFVYRLGHFERVCCTVAYDANKLTFDDDVFQKYWEGFALANGDSLQHSMESKD